MARAKRQEKRRAELVAAAQRAMVEHGVDSVQLNQVAEQAGVASGTVLYYYPDVDELLREAAMASMERFYSGRARCLEDSADPAERLVAMVRSGLPEDAHDIDVRLLCELGGSAGRHRLTAALLTTLFDRQVGMYEVILEQGAARGVFTLAQQARSIARTIVALEDAYGYRIVAGHPVIDAAAAIELILDYARVVTGHPLELTHHAAELEPEAAPAAEATTAV